MCKKESASVSPEIQSNPSGSEITGSVNAAENAAAGQTQMDKFQAEQGHGYAAEQANNLYDLLHGRDAVIVGGDNAKDSADRKVDGTLIQTKYCHNASASVQAAFRNGQYRYLTPNGTLMQLEVPSDQYEDAVRLMQKRIEAGQVPGVTDPNDAKSLVRRGSFTYQQAVSLTKFGTIESLTYDATNGTIVAANAFGITAALTFAQHLWRGDPPEVAIEYAAYSGLKIGGAAFINTIVTSQLMRTALPKTLVVPTDTVVKLLGPKASAIIANSLRERCKHLRCSRNEQCLQAFKRKCHHRSRYAGRSFGFGYPELFWKAVSPANSYSKMLSHLLAVWAAGCIAAALFLPFSRAV